MARKKKTDTKQSIESYEHLDKQRVNNPPAGLVNESTDPDSGEKNTYAYDPHLDPQLQWAGKAEHTSFQVPTVSLHVHERIDPRTIIKSVQQGNGDVNKQLTLFDLQEQNRPLREAIEFYKHEHNWSNRLVAGDSLLVMNSLLEKEAMAGKVQMIYIDPPYGIKYGSNFQPFINNRDVKDGKDDDLTSEPEQVRAFRDTWELGIHSYLTYMRDRLLLSREMLTESGSVFVQISDENIHHVKELMDEVFGAGNFVSLITFKKTTGLTGKLLTQVSDYIIWYAKDIANIKYRTLYSKKILFGTGATHYNKLMLNDGTTRSIKRNEMSNPELLPEGAKIYEASPMISQGNPLFTYIYQGKEFPGTYKTTKQGIDKLALANRLEIMGSLLRYRRYIDDYPVFPITNIWEDILGIQSRSDPKVYVVQTSTSAIQRCLLMTTDPGDLVFDPTCGSGTTAYVAEQWGRRWITCDTSRVALTLAKQRLMTAVYDYYELAHPDEGVGSGFKYKTVPHITLKSIANNPDIREGMSRKEIDAAIKRHAPHETLYDQPLVDRKKKRVSGPFTVEAVPAPAVRSVEEVLETTPSADDSISRSGETLRQAEWRDELQRTGIRAKGGQYIYFSRIEPMPGCRWLHADGETRPSNENDAEDESGLVSTPQRIAVSFGPEHAPLEQRQVELAIEEAQTLVPKPKVIVFAAFQFDPEAAKDIDETNWPGVTLLKAQMNADLLTDDLKKKRSSNESFWLIGQPDVQVEKIAKGEDKGKYRISVHGFDYYNTKTGNIESGGSDKIAVWLLDTDYDGRSLYPNQVFFPQAGAKDGWARLAKNLKAEIDEDLIEAYRGTTSLSFDAGENRQVAVKIVDDRGIESLKVMGLK